MSQPDCQLNARGRKNINLQEASRLFESLQASRAALILHQQSDFEFSNVILGQETSIFTKFHDFQIFDLMVQNLGLVQTVDSAYGSS